uniref:ATP synthase F0 subunit 8 n=1 Tax=Romanomermis culicivorax TaxID=13658 RepID=A0A915KH14_ROMCU
MSITLMAVLILWILLLRKFSRCLWSTWKKAITPRSTFSRELRGIISSILSTVRTARYISMPIKIKVVTNTTIGLTTDATNMNFVKNLPAICSPIDVNSNDNIRESPITLTKASSLPDLCRPALSTRL